MKTENTGFSLKKVKSPVLLHKSVDRIRNQQKLLMTEEKKHKLGTKYDAHTSCSDISFKNTIIGEGEFSTVQLANYDNQQVAIKCLRAVSNVFDFKIMKETCKREIDVLKKLNGHDNVLELLGFSWSQYFIITKYYSNGCLSTFLQKNRIDRTSDTFFRIFLDIVQGMAFIHSNSIVHRDLKSSNVLIDSNFRACISDFGCSSEIGKDSNIIAGHKCWRAPELFATAKSNRYSFECDVYSFGILLWEMVHSCKYTPNGQLSYSEYFENTFRYKFRPQISPSVPKFYADLIKKCWSQNPLERPTFKQILAIVNDTNFEKPTRPTNIVKARERISVQVNNSLGGYED